MNGTNSIKYCIVWGLGLLIGLMGSRPAAAAYNVLAGTAKSVVTISGNAKVDTGLITTFVINSNTVSGDVKCGAQNLPPNTVNHYTHIDLPMDYNLNRFRINENLSMSATTTSKNSPVNAWSYESSVVCSNRGGTDKPPASDMMNAYPITLSFYVKHRPIDNLITFPAMPLGGYIRAFGAKIGVTGKAYAIPILLAGGTISLPTSCRAFPNSLTIDHGTVPRGLSAHRMSTPITYACDTPVKATFTLSYEADRNGALTLKDTSGTVGAVSKLTITDPDTLASGRSIHAEIQRFKTFTVSSELSQITGNGAISGSAWLIATHD
ncbi:hypothetical protein SOASR032_14260 [Pragia fontium]|uniref:Fimbrial protein n=1 Tax=Pragia fontium TaxID=82985 RepID=A0ABQ5LJ44_9GAMM|nr:hypothetical protein [Pragia fontium]GKX62857.1 hypothetical protein SOASR032_14260 [Pragia fontium]